MRVKVKRWVNDAVEEVLDWLLSTIAIYMYITAIICGTFLYFTYPSRTDIRFYSEQDLGTERDAPFYYGCVNTEGYLQAPEYKKMNAAFVMLTRNNELKDVLSSMNSIEAHFNQWFKYPYVFLNDEPFSEEFKKSIREATDADIEFGTLDESQWEFPEEVRNTFEYQNAITDQGDRGILYGNMESYHKMCRFYSGIFYKHPLMQKYEWYWRLEPDVEFFCDLTYDPFFEMHRRNKKYAFTMIIPEIYWTVPNLFRYTKAFIREYGVKVGTLWKLFATNYDILKTDKGRDEFTDYENMVRDDLHQWVKFGGDVEPKLSEKVAIDHLLESETADDDVGLMFLVNRARSKVPLIEDEFEGEEYNLCHFWSNFEIARLDVFDNEVYNSYFQYLEASGGFWKERWGDAPVHSIGLALTLDVDDIHYFRDIGYMHSILKHCPKNSPDLNEFKYKPANKKYKRSSWTRYDTPIEGGSGCRCRCPSKPAEVEDTITFCFEKWMDVTHLKKGEVELYQLFNIEEKEEMVRNDFERHHQQRNQ